MAGDRGRSETGGEGKDRSEIILHASCVAHSGRGLLLRGASGSGKSQLSLALMALGARLVADDRVIVERTKGGPIARAPDPIAGLIEARGIGLLRASAQGPVPVVCVVDLDRSETARMPAPRRTTLLGHPVDLLFRAETPHFSAALMQYLKEGRQTER